ncbi:MAG: hypothetical protein ABFD79_07865 [Phycisphaerales bacterium]
MKTFFGLFIFLFFASLCFAPVADELTINSVCFENNRQKNIIHIAGNSLDATVDNWKQDTKMDVTIFADDKTDALVSKSIPLDKFTYSGGKLIYKGSAPLINFQIKIVDKSFIVTAAKKDFSSINSNVTLEISLGSYTGKGTGKLDTSLANNR